MKTLADHAEAWWRESGKKVPPRGTTAWTEMYLDWIDFAFPNTIAVILNQRKGGRQR